MSPWQPGEPRVTVLMSVYNGEEYLRGAIDSVLNQTFHDFEFLIVDDGSRDRSREIVAAYDDPRIRLIANEQNIGLIDSLNKGIAAARGDLIARQDADDVLAPHRLQRQVAFFDANADAVLVGAWLQLIDEHDANITVWRHPENDLEIRWKLLFNSAVGHSAAMYRTGIARQVGGYRRDFALAEDYEFWSRLGEHGRMHNIPEVLQYYRVHRASVTRTSSAAQSEKRVAISSGLIAAASRERLPRPLVELLARSLPATDRRELLVLAEAYRRLLDGFVDQHHVPRSLRLRLESDIAERLSTAVQGLGFRARLLSAPALVRWFPDGFVGGPRLASWLLGERGRSIVKRLLGRRS